MVQLWLGWSIGYVRLHVFGWLQQSLYLGSPPVVEVRVSVFSQVWLGLAGQGGLLLPWCVLPR